MIREILSTKGASMPINSYVSKNNAPKWQPQCHFAPSIE